MKNNSYPAFFTLTMFQDALSAARSDDDLIRLVCWPIANIAAPRSRWRAAGYSEALRDDAVIFAVEALWLHMMQRKDHISPTQATLYRLIRIAKNSVAMVLRKEEKHSRHCIISASTPSCFDEDEDPLIYAVDAAMANRYQDQETGQLERIIVAQEIENILQDPRQRNIQNLVGTLMMLSKILPQLSTTYITVNELIRWIDDELEPLAVKMGISRIAIETFYNNVRALIGPGISRERLKRWMYNRTRKKRQTALSL